MYLVCTRARWPQNYRKSCELSPILSFPFLPFSSFISPSHPSLSPSPLSLSPPFSFPLPSPPSFPLPSFPHFPTLPYLSSPIFLPPPFPFSSFTSSLSLLSPLSFLSLSLLFSSSPPCNAWLGLSPGKFVFSER